MNSSVSYNVFILTGLYKKVMTEIAEARNAIPLPLVPERYGLRLPPERSALTGINFQIIPKVCMSDFIAIFNSPTLSSVHPNP